MKRARSPTDARGSAAGSGSSAGGSSAGGSSAGKEPRHVGRSRVVLDVGGHEFVTCPSTLVAASSYFRSLYSETWGGASDERLFLDRDHEPFALLLSYMRSGLLELPAESPSLARRVLHEAEFFGVDGLLREVKAAAWRARMPRWAGTETEAAALFDAEHGALADAIRSGVLPQAYFEASAPPPPPPTAIQLLPAPRGCRIKVARRNDTNSSASAYPVICLALVDHPRPFLNHAEGEESQAVNATLPRLDAYITHPSKYGAVLASEAYGRNTKWTEFVTPDPQKDEVMALPQDMNLTAEFWRDASDHSQGTYVRPLRTLRYQIDEDGDRQMDVVELGEHPNEADRVWWRSVATRADFKGFRAL